MRKRTRPYRVSDRIASDIKRQIAMGSLGVGHRLPAERDLAQQYGVSRVSVREAYRSLAELRLIRIRRGRDGGAFIDGSDTTPVEEALTMLFRLGQASPRELGEAWLVEPVVARLAARNAAPSDLERLRRVTETGEPSTPASIARRRLRFYEAVARCAHNLPLAALVTGLARAAAVDDGWLATAGLSDQVQRAQREIYGAIARRDEDGAARLMREYLAQVRQWAAAAPLVGTAGAPAAAPAF